MRYSSQAILGLLAVLSIASVQTFDMSHGARHYYVRAVSDIGTDDGLIFDTSAGATKDIMASLHGRKATSSN